MQLDFSRVGHFAEETWALPGSHHTVDIRSLRVDQLLIALEQVATLVLVTNVHDAVVVVAAPINTLRVEVEFGTALPPANEVDALDEGRELELQH